MALTLSDYFISEKEKKKKKKAGDIEVLCEIDPHGSTLDELDEEMAIARATIYKRITELRELSLIETRAITDESRIRRRHALTPRGATVRLALDDMGTTGAYQQYKAARKRYDEHAQRSRERILSNPDALEKEKANKNDLERLLARPEYTNNTDDEE